MRQSLRYTNLLYPHLMCINLNWQSRQGQAVGFQARYAGLARIIS